MEKTLSLDISGKVFRVRTVTLDKIQGTLLNELDTDIRCHYFERDPHLFRHILNAYRYDLVHVPRDICPLLFKEELLFWKIPLTLVAPCCWKYLYEVDSDIETVKILIQNEKIFEKDEPIVKATESIIKTVNIADHSDIPDKYKDKQTEEKDKVKRLYSFWQFLDDPASSPAAKV
jgi:hypothetical protein